MGMANPPIFKLCQSQLLAGRAAREISRACPHGPGVRWRDWALARAWCAMKRLPLAAACLLLPCCLMAACDDVELGDTIRAEEGMVQPRGNGEPIDEQAACARIVSAEEQARFRVGCPDPQVLPTCPAYVRPAGTRTCLMYDEGTVEACERVIGDYQSCQDFDRMPCVITALDEPAQGCDLGGAGAAGAAGAGGAAGSTAGAAGAGGAGGAAGSATAGTAGSMAGSSGQSVGGAGGGAWLPTAGTAG
jgi:hypothetical protein